MRAVTVNHLRPVVSVLHARMRGVALYGVLDAAFKTLHTRSMLQACVRRVCETDRLGGELTNRDKYTCILSNYAAMCSAQLNEIQRQRPRVTYVIQACSTGGFLAIFHEEQHSDVLQSADFFAVLVSGMMVAASVSLLT